MAEYMLFLWDDEDAMARADTAAMEQLMQAHSAFIDTHRAALRGGNRLHPSEVATSLRRDADGAVQISDGVFAETKEIIGGYYLIEAADLDEALRIARDVPAPFGGPEIRPVFPTQTG